MRLEDFNLNKSAEQSVLSYAKSGKFPQTILVEGADDETRHSFARFIANMLVCTAESEKPCGICSACVKCNADSHPDIKEFVGEKPSMTFKVELSREIRADAFVIPNDGDKKVFILLETQNMNESAANAMLKILEEPPKFDYFIMTCPGRSAMLSTVLSRATVINIGHSEASFSQDAVDMAENIAMAVCADNEISMLEKLSELINKKDLFTEVTACLKVIFIDSLKYKQTEKNDSDYADVVEELCSRLAVQRIYSLITVVGELEDAFSRNANYNLLMTKMSSSLRTAAGK